MVVSAEEMISLECPHCQGELYYPVLWFKRESFTCPACGEVLTAEDFSGIIAALEEAMDHFDAEMFDGEAAASCCCGGKGGCSGREGS